jgi:hypothetical protein
MTASEFWRELGRKQWELEPVLIERPFAEPLATPAEMMPALRAAGDRVRAGERARPDEVSYSERLFVEGQFRYMGPDVGRYLPGEADCSAAGYAERLTRMLGGQKFALVLNDFQIYDRVIWNRWRKLLRALPPEMPPQIGDLVVLFGNYDGTPFGVHQDTRHTLMYLVEGSRRFRLWPDAYFRRPDREDAQATLDYRPYLDDAITLEARAGDLLYWPSSYWHVGECAEGHSLGLCVGLEPYRPHVEAWRRLAPRIQAAVEAADRAALALPAADRADAGACLREVAEIAARAGAEAAGDAGLVESLTAFSLNRRSGSGFNRVPLPGPRPRLADEDRIQGCPEDPVLWQRVGRHRLLCSAGGQSFAVPASPPTLALLRRLTEGAVSRVGDLIREYAGLVVADGVQYGATPEAIRSLLEELCALGAIRRR